MTSQIKKKHDITYKIILVHRRASEMQPNHCQHLFSPSSQDDNREVPMVEVIPPKEEEWRLQGLKPTLWPRL